MNLFQNNHWYVQRQRQHIGTGIWICIGCLCPHWMCVLHRCQMAGRQRESHYDAIWNLVLSWMFVCTSQMTPSATHWPWLWWLRWSMRADRSSCRSVPSREMENNLATATVCTAVCVLDHAVGCICSSNHWRQSTSTTLPGNTVVCRSVSHKRSTWSCFLTYSQHLPDNAAIHIEN